MIIELLYGGISERIELPKGVIELQDILDRMTAEGGDYCI